MNYYNEFDPFAAQWLRNLIADGQIPDGEVDERDIREVTPRDIAGYRQVHLFAGIGGWPLALEFAGWGDRPVWTASCPCPIVSTAKGRSSRCPGCGSKEIVWLPADTGWAGCGRCVQTWPADEKHLWPEVWRLIREQEPAIVFGEQVAEVKGAVWWSGVQASLEICGYAVGSAVLPAAGVGAPHGRSRRFFVAVDNPYGDGRQPGTEQPEPECERSGGASASPVGVAQPDPSGLEGHAGNVKGSGQPGWFQPFSAGHPAENGWNHIAVVECDDGKRKKYRHVSATEPEVWPLAYGLPKGLGSCDPGIRELAAVAGGDGQNLREAKRYRVGAIRGYGNAIVPQVAAAFIKAVME